MVINVLKLQCDVTFDSHWLITGQASSICHILSELEPTTTEVMAK